MKITLRELDGTSRGYYLLLGVLALVTAIGMGAVWTMEHNGHIVTGIRSSGVCPMYLPCFWWWRLRAR